MKKVLWIACLLCLIPFMGQAQKHAGLTQDPEAAFGQARVSKELPAKIQMRNVRKGGDTFVAHAMYVPEAGFNFGRYYLIASDGTVTQKRMYNDWYYSAAEYFEGGEEAWPVYAFSNDHTVGYSNIEFTNGNANALDPVNLNMNEITYDYNHERMLGTKYGYIYEVSMDHGTVGEYLYDYNEHSNIQPIAMAADLDGTLYFIALSEIGATAKLYKFEADDEDLTTPIEIGDLGYEARKIQTMAFNHASKHRELYWWQCDEEGNTNFLEIDKKTAAVTVIAGGLNTEMAGLFFEFKYEDHTVYCIDDEESLTLEDDETATSIATDGRSAQYLPGKNVVVTVADVECKTLDSIVVRCKEDGEIIYTSATIGGVTINGNEATFAMVAMDVNVDAIYSGNSHEIEVTWTPATLTNAITTSPASIGACGDAITINYGHPEGYILIQNTLTVNNQSSVVTVNASQYKATFVMPDEDATVNGQYGNISVGQLDNICQYRNFSYAPAFNKPSNLSNYNYVIELYKPGSTSVTASLTDTEFKAYEFTINGTWRYRIKVTNMYGVFYTAYKNFTVYQQPQSITLEGQQYNCMGGEITLNAVPTPEGSFPAGTFTWKKNGTLVATTTEPTLVIANAQATDAGTYAVIFKSTTGNCEYYASPLAVNVASLPNTPIISIVDNDGQNPICYHSSVTLQWDYGYLYPEEYYITWFTISDSGEWTEIPDEHDIVCQTDVLVAAARYGIEIRYVGDYFDCFSRSDVYTVNVMDESIITLNGATSTCQYIIPDSATWPSISEEYTECKWYFDGEELGETDHILHMKNSALNGNLVNEVGVHTISVSAINGTVCDSWGEMSFEVLPLPEIEISNNIDPEIIATPGRDGAATLWVCEGTAVTLTATGGDSYDWGDFNSSNASILFNATENGVYQCTATYDETGCSNTAYVYVNVYERPTVEWVNPAVETEYSMMAGVGIDIENLMVAPGETEMLQPIQLEATPAGGIFTYVIEGDPTNTVYPIDGGILYPAKLGIGDYQLIYTYENEHGCTNEERIIKIHVRKPYWTDEGIYDSTWFDNCVAAGRFEISNPHELGAYAAVLRGMYGPAYDFEGDTIYITDDINLLEKPYFYRTVNGFKGVFDGNGKIVYNTVLYEDDLDLNIDGTIRNLGVVDANFTSVNSVNQVRVNGDVLNSFVTMPILNNVEPYLASKGHISNVYYRGNIKGEMSSIWYDNMCNPTRFIMPVEIPELLGDSTVELTHFNVADPYYTYDGELEEWVWLKNDFTYMYWTHDYEGTINHGWPYMTSHFIHHHFVDVVYDQEEVDATLGGTRTRTIKGDDYEYALNYDKVDITIAEEDYMVIDSVYAKLIYPDATEEDITIDEVSDLYYEYTLPADSLYEPAYDVEFHIVAHRDFWTDEPNYDANWYTNQLPTGRFEITNPAELAALAWECDFNGHNFDGDTIFINGSGDGTNWVMNMDDHAWEPIYNFHGVLDGTHFIVEHLFIATRDKVARPQLAMFVNETAASKGSVEPEEPEEEEVTFYDGEETNEFVPFYGYWADAHVHSEWIIADTVLTDLVGKQINALTFYVAVPVDNQDVQWELYMMETEKQNFNDEYFEPEEPKIVENETGEPEEDWNLPEGATLVYTGNIDVENRYFTIEFDTPFVYNGGNLYFCSKNVAPGRMWYDSELSFIGSMTTEVTYQAGYWTDEVVEEELEVRGKSGEKGELTFGRFLPKMSFRFVEAPVSAEGVIRNFILKDVYYQKNLENIATLVNGGDMTVYNSAVTYDPALNKHLDIAVFGEGQSVKVINTYTLDENGLMITQEGAPIDFGDLRAWVATTNEPYYWDWKLDEQPYINYNYPIHENAWIPGLQITYIPSIEAPENGCFIDGPASAIQGEQVCVTSSPALGYQLTELKVDGVDILPDMCFEMPDHSIVVEAEFDPIQWNFIINYEFAEGTNPGTGDVLPTPNPEIHQYINGETDVIVPPTIPGFEPTPEVINVEMPNHHETITVTYDGIMHDIFACDFAEVEYATFSTNAEAGTDPAIGQARNTHDFTLTITPIDGYTIINPELIKVIADDGFDTELDILAESWEGTSLTITVRMPNYDVTLEACDPLIYGEIYWTDYGIRDITWYVGHEDETEFVLTTDSMLGGLSALVNGLCDVAEGPFEYSNGVYPAIDFSGCTFILESAQEPNEINLIEHLWRPIGAQVDEKDGFNGYFDGNGVKITNMKTSEHMSNLGQPGACMALFGNVDEEGVVNNVDVAGTSTGRYFTAGIVAINNGLLLNSVSHVNIKSEFEAGGIVSVNLGDIYNCYCDAEYIINTACTQPSKEAHNYYIGGIVALNQGLVENCHTVAEIKGEGLNPINYFGGAIGVNQGVASFLYWKSLTNGVGEGNALTDSEKLTNSNYATIAEKMNTHAGSINLAYPLFGWTTMTGVKYPVFDELLDKVLNSNDNEINVVLYPNPTNGLVRIETENIQKVTVYNMFGQQVLEVENENSIDLSGFSAGVYMVRIATNEGVAVKNVIVEK